MAQPISMVFDLLYLFVSDQISRISIQIDEILNKLKKITLIILSTE